MIDLVIIGFIKTLLTILRKKINRELFLTAETLIGLYLIWRLYLLFGM